MSPDSPKHPGDASEVAEPAGGGRAMDVVVGAGPGGLGEVAVFDVRTGVNIADFLAFSARYTGDVTMACGDVDGDGVADIIVGMVAVFSGNSFALQSEFFAFGAGYTGGVSVGVSDLDGNCVDSILVGSRAGTSLVEAVNVNGTPVLSLMAFPGPTGVNVTGLDGGILVSAGGKGGPLVEALTSSGQVQQEFYAFNPDFTGGVSIA